MWTPWLLLLLVAVIEAQKPIANVRYSWKYINYTWPSVKEYNQAIADGDYIPKNNVLIGIKVWKDKFYFALPRLKPGVPVTLATAPYQPVEDDQSPYLQPYPNWEMQKMDDCKALQTVQAMEIDPSGRMWVINNGRIIHKNSTKVCQHRLIVFDLENDNRILLDYEFPKDIVDPDTGYLNDIVLDHTDGGYAYITNSDDVKPSIVIFSLQRLTSWQVKDKSMEKTDVNFSVKGHDSKFPKAPSSTVNGIALASADFESYRVLYFTPISSRRIFYVHTAFLKSMNNISDYVHTLDSSMPKTHTAGMIMNSNNELYFGMLEENTIGVWLASEKKFRRAYSDPKLQWIDTYVIDEDGHMWVTINRLPRINADKIDLNEINYRVIELDQLAFKNYQYYRNGSAPDLPLIES